jgi:hypothetical protein
VSDPGLTTRTAQAIILAAFKILMPSSATRIQGVSDLADLLLQDRRNRRARKTLAHRLEESSDFLAERLSQFEEAEYPDLDPAEKQQAIEGVCAGVENMNLESSDVIKSRIDSYRVARRILPYAKEQWLSMGLSDEAVSYGKHYLEVAALYITTIVRELPELNTDLLTTIYDVTEQIHYLLQKGIATAVMPKFREGTEGEASAFEAVYLSDIIQTYKDMELFGLTGIPKEFCRLPIDVAYITLRTRIPSAPSRTRGMVASPIRRVDAALQDVLQANTVTDQRGEKLPNPSRGTRILLTGPAGSGKTTVAHWLAIRAAQRRFPTVLNQWNSNIPFLVPLRDIFHGYKRYSPTDNDLIEASSRRESADVPGDWIRSHLQASPLIVLDGLDELSDLHKSDFRIWLEKLERDYPLSHIIVTSRPDGLDRVWFGQRRFAELELQSMELEEIRLSISRWFQAVISADPTKETSYLKRKGLLLRHIEGRSAVKELAETPLVCAMLCAFYSYNLSDSAPRSRSELYQRVINTLVHERDEARFLEQARLANVTLSTKLTLLQAIARYMTERSISSIRCFPIPAEIGVSEISPARDETAQDVLAERLRGMPPVGVSVHELLQLLLERSMVFRKIAANDAAFAHRSLQEYLAASDYADSGAVADLLRRSHLPNWRNMLAFAASKLSVPQATTLVSGLLDAAERDPAGRRDHLLLAAQCYGSAKRLDRDVSDRANGLIQTILPPRDLDEAELISYAGESVLPWLDHTAGFNLDTSVACMRAAALIGGSGSLSVLRQYALSAQYSRDVVSELLHDWQYFDATDYVRTVLSVADLSDHVVLADTKPMLDAFALLDGAKRVRVNVAEGLQTFESWKRLKHLEEIDYPNSSSIMSLRGLAELPRLRKLRLSGSKSLSDISDLSQMARLRELYLADCKNVHDLSYLAAAANLSVLVLDGYEDGIDSGLLLGLGRLLTLSLVGSPVGDLDFLNDMPQLRRLAVVSASGLRDTTPIGRLESLRRLDARLAPASEREPVKLPSASLEDVRLSGYLSGEDVSAIGQCHALRELVIRNADGLRSLGSLAELRELVGLEIAGCSGLRDPSAISRAVKLERLDLSGSSIDTLSFLRDMRGLRELRLRNCKYLSDTSILGALPSLELVDLTGSNSAALSDGVGRLAANGNRVVVIRDSFDTVDAVLDGGFYGPTG